jgi:hypothetical protein
MTGPLWIGALDSDLWIPAEVEVLEVFVGFYGGEYVVFAGYPYVEGGQQEDTDD